MGLRAGRGTLDPRYFRHAVPVIEGDMIATIEISVPFDGTQEPYWDDATGAWVSPAAVLIWQGKARIQPNKDWRARNREWSMENTAEHAIRVQLNLAKNLLVPREAWPADPVDIQHGHIVHVIDNPDDPLLTNYLMTVRNPIGASDSWHRTLLCDVDLGGRVDG